MLTPNGVDGKTELLQDTVNGHDRTVLFVNSTAHPDKQVALNHYKYQDYFDERVFLRLYEDTWTIDLGDGFAVNYSMYVWRIVSVKGHCKQALSNMIDGFESVEEFLL